MADLAQKLQNATNENLILVLAVQILLGFQLRAPFEPGFPNLPPGSHLLSVAATALFVASFLLLVAPVPFHRIVYAREVSTGLQSFNEAMVAAGLVAFLAALTDNIFVMTRSTAPLAGWLAAAFAGVMFWLWYGLALLRRSRPGQREPMAEQPPLVQRIQHDLMEVRVILPGAQALLGFQFATFLMPAFQQLPPSLKALHVVALGLVALATIVLMSPAAFHRIAEKGEDSERVPRFTTWMILTALPLLVFGIALDLRVVIVKAIGEGALSVAVPVATIGAAAALWAVYPLMRRRQRTA